MEYSPWRSKWLPAGRIVFQLLTPFILLLSSVFFILITARGWVQIEYRMPGFPDDPYGFTLEDRLYWSSIDIDFLLSGAEMDYFDDLRLEDGSPMHNARELKHMEDVKQLLGLALKVWVALWGFLFLLGILIWVTGSKTLLLRSLIRGAKWTLFTVVAIALGVVFAFGGLFVGFHRIFFEGNTWLFPYSDTFIRLYPERFWRDSFILIALVTVLLAGVVFLVARTMLSRAGFRADQTSSKV